MIRLHKFTLLALAALPLLVCTVLVSKAHAARYYRQYPPNNGYSYEDRRTGLYMGGSLGFDTPEGSSQQGMYVGFGWTFKFGFQFIPELALEFDYHESFGNFSDYGVDGTWTFLQLPAFAIKPMIPLPSSDLYFIAGLSYDFLQNTTTNLPINGSLSSNGPGYDVGMGYEWYITPNATFGGEAIYHYYSNNTFTASGGGVSSTFASNYYQDMSFTSWNLNLAYHF